MTATALINDPLLDQPPVGRPPELRLVGPPTVAQDSAATIELYRRRRFIAALIVTVAVLVGTQLFGVSLLDFGSLGAPDATAEAIPVVHVVGPGDTYGSIAASFGVARPDQLADELQSLNGGAELDVGQRLVIAAELVD